MREKLKIVVIGYLVRGPTGGLSWSPLHYMRGLHELGHDVLFLEDSDDYPACLDPFTGEMSTDPTIGLDLAGRAFDLIGMPGMWCYYDAHTGSWLGPAADRALAFCRDADLLINVGAVTPLRDWTEKIPSRAYVDLDPLFNQARNIDNPGRTHYALRHNSQFTVGEELPQGTSLAPNDGIEWKATRHPIALSQWPVQPPRPHGPYTTIMQWDSYATRTIGGEVFGMKAASFEPYAGLPARIGFPLTMATAGRAPKSMSESEGWIRHEPSTVAPTPEAYRDYIGSAKAEWTIAKEGYVKGRTGWFSERSAAFLATGRPVITQDTDNKALRSLGAGVLFFSDLDEAAAAIELVENDYERQCKAARAVAEDYFDSAKVLTEMIEQCRVTA